MSWLRRVSLSAGAGLAVSYCFSDEDDIHEHGLPTGILRRDFRPGYI